jgi:hypothetical protein
MFRPSVRSKAVAVAASNEAKRGTVRTFKNFRWSELSDEEANSKLLFAQTNIMYFNY